MNFSKKLSSLSISWFGIGMSAIFLLSIGLRFWGLERFNALVFDEVYYAIYSNNYLIGKQFFNAHPPFSQYIIAIGIWIGSHLPIGQDTVNGLTGSMRSTWSYRWLNALTGSFIPLVVAAIAYQLNGRRRFAFIAGLFAAADGLFLVESRYALNNVYLVIFGLLGQLFFLIALNQSKQRRWLNLALSGVFFGASACIKWNGLWFLLGVYLIWVVAHLMQWLLPKPIALLLPAENTFPSDLEQTKTPLQNLTQLKVFDIFWNFAIIPVLTYSILWIPHLKMNPTPNFWQAQKDILEFHEKIGSGPETHPYCSNWYSWLLMWRPVAYFYQTGRDTTEQVPAYPPLPDGSWKYIYDVHAMGNPFLWWLSTAAIFGLLFLLTIRLIKGVGWKIPPTYQTWIALYFLLNWLAQLLPWVRVTRCIFLYHYMGASVFSGLALAWVVDGWLSSKYPEFRSASFTVIVLVLFALVFWLPIYLGLPLSSQDYQLRMWFQSWI